jgi:dihydrofolate reductase
MRKVILFMHVSVDGFVCGPNGEQDWMTMNDVIMDRFMVSHFYSRVDTMLIGRVLYQGFENFWPAVAKSKDYPEDLIEFAHWMENTPKIVFSRTLNQLSWANSRLAKDEPVEEVRKLKEEKGGDMVIFGGAGIIEYFTRHNIVDEYQIKLEPIILGQGRPLFKDLKERIPLTLMEGKSFDSGVVGLIYSVKRSS